jgi:hypothetical protein
MIRDLLVRYMILQLFKILVAVGRTGKLSVFDTLLTVVIVKAAEDLWNNDIDCLGYTVSVYFCSLVIRYLVN